MLFGSDLRTPATGKLLVSTIRTPSNVKSHVSMYYVPFYIGIFYYTLNFSGIAIAESDFSDTCMEPRKKTPWKPCFEFSSSHTSQSTDTEKKTSAESSENVCSRQDYSGTTQEFKANASSSTSDEVDSVRTRKL